MSPKTKTPAVQRPNLDELGLSMGKKVRLHRMLYENGLKNGTLLILPIDQGLEHGPVDFFPNPASADPDFQWRLAIEGNYNAIALHYGLARKYMTKWAGRIPLVLKLNGKTSIPSDADALSTMTGSVEDAVSMGADAVGYTLYVGSPRQDEDFLQLQSVREDCDRYGMPLIVWSYPRGSAIEEKGDATRSTPWTTPPAWRSRWAPTSSSSTCRSTAPRTSTSPRSTLRWTTRTRKVRSGSSRPPVAASCSSAVAASSVTRT